MARLRALPSRLAAPAPKLGDLATAGSGFARLDGRNRHQRGYGNDWSRLRLRILEAEPLCRFCASEGRVTPATEVDHIEPFRGVDDPRRLDPANLRPLCRPCHLSRTARQATGGRSVL